MNRSAQAVVRVGSRDAAAAYISQHRCPCAGPWTVISSAREILAARRLARPRDQVTEQVSMRCEVCGTTTAVTFVLPQRSPPVFPDGAQADRDVKAREQHYVFAHRLLRERVFADPEGFAAIMRQPHARDWLVRLWERAYEQTAVVVPALNADGLDLTWDTVADADCLIITMPPAEVSPEAVAVAVVGTRGEWRYFPFERLGPDDGRAVLCEWRADGSRRNHGLVAGQRLTHPDVQQFLAVLQEHFEDEGRHRADQPPPGGYWKPGSEEPGLEAMVGTFRRQPCVFAFHVLPAVIAELAEELADPDDRRRSDVLLRLWRRAGGSDQDESPQQSARVTSSVHNVGGRRFLVIEPPPPVAPPEPRFIAVLISAEGRPRCELPVHTLELSSRQRDARPILGQVSPDLGHGILGCLPDSELDTFLSAVAGQIIPAHVDTMPQLLRYAMVNSMTE